MLELIKTKTLRTIIVAFSVLLMTGCASMSTHDENDPLEPINRGIYQFNETADEYVIEPLAKGYQFVTPEFIDEAITNFFSNLDDVVVLVNDILQLKFNQAASDGGRLLINSTIGLLGFIDVATDMGFEKHNEDFGQTLGAYGVGSGPYIVLPLLGPSTMRDTVGLVADTFVDPVHHIEGDDAMWATIAVEGIDTRADLISTKNVVDEASLDSYDFLKNAYLQRREYLIHDGNPPLEDESILDE